MTTAKHGKKGRRRSQDKGDVDLLKKELAEKEELLNTYLEDLKRVKADFENFAKRVDKESEKLFSKGAKTVLESMLAVKDDFERALESLSKDAPSQLVKGVELIYQRFKKALEEHGVKELKSLGEKLDPYLHEAVQSVEHHSEQGTIVAEVQKGYLYKDELLRPSKVIVSKGRGGERNEQDNRDRPGD